MGIGTKLYDGFMKPLESLRLSQKRRELMVDVSGDVLEIGFGTGVNLKHYPYEQIDSLTLIDQKLVSYLNTRCIPVNTAFNIHKGDVMALPFEDETFDSVVMTLVFCSVADPVKGIEEVNRVLKPEGRLYFIEHVLPTKEPYKGLFKKITPVWKKVAHGCHLNRETVTLIQQSGMRLMGYHRFFRTSFATGIAIKNHSDN